MDQVQQLQFDTLLSVSVLRHHPAAGGIAHWPGKPGLFTVPSWIIRA